MIRALKLEVAESVKHDIKEDLEEEMLYSILREVKNTIDSTYRPLVATVRLVNFTKIRQV